MRTRSQSKNQNKDVIIDFDEASRAWTTNKKKCKNGCYQYICSAVTKTGEPCKNTCLPMVGCSFCRIHNNK